MGLGILAELLSAVLALTIGSFTTSDLIARFVKKNLWKKKVVEKPYSEQLTELTTSLNNSTKEVDRILAELEVVTKGREQTLKKLEKDLVQLEEREKETKKRIEDLQNIPIAVAEHFALMTKEGEKRSAKRDYILFGAGVGVSTIIAIILKILGWG